MAEMLVIKGEPAPLREIPDVASPILLYLQPGDAFPFLGYSGNWSKIMHESTQRYVPYGPESLDNISVMDDHVYKQLVLESLLYFIENNKVILFEGTIDADGSFKIEEDFSLGDIVTIENAEGHGGNCRIVEFMYSEDQDNGLRVYPTFSKI